MKKIIIWVLGVLLSLSAGILWWHSWMISVEELGRTVDNVSVAYIGGLILCSLVIGLSIVLHLIILFQSHKYLRCAELSARDLTVSHNDTIGIKTIKIIGYFLIMLYLCDILLIIINYAARGNIDEIMAMLLAVAVTALFLMWFSTISQYRPKGKPVKSLSIALMVGLLIGGPVILFPLISKLLLLFSTGS